MTSPRIFTSGPPEFPGLIAVSVWKNSTWLSFMARLSLALIIPWLTLSSRPKGFPIAITIWPTRTLSESPIGNGVRFSRSIFNTAKSICPSDPDNFCFGLAAVTQLHGDIIRSIQHVVVGHDVSLFGNDHARPERGYLLLSRLSSEKRRPKKAPEDRRASGEKRFLSS